METHKLEISGDKLEKCFENLTASDGTEFRFGVTEDGRYGYEKNGKIIPFGVNNIASFILVNNSASPLNLPFYPYLGEYFSAYSNNLNVNSPAEYRIKILKDIDVKQITFYALGRNNATSCRRRLLYNDTVLYDKNINEIDFKSENPTGFDIGIHKLKKDDEFILQCWYYNASMKYVRLDIYI